MRSTPADSPSYGPCPVCGRPASEGESWYDGERLVHSRCRDWSQHQFPLDWELQRLRRLSRVLRGALRAVDDAGVWLASAKAAWPRDANVRLDQWAIKRARLGEVIGEMVGRVGRLK